MPYQNALLKCDWSSKIWNVSAHSKCNFTPYYESLFGLLTLNLASTTNDSPANMRQQMQSGC